MTNKDIQGLANIEYNKGYEDGIIYARKMFVNYMNHIEKPYFYRYLSEEINDFIEKKIEFEYFYEDDFLEWLKHYEIKNENMTPPCF